MDAAARDGAGHDDGHQRPSRQNRPELQPRHRVSEQREGSVGVREEQVPGEHRQAVRGAGGGAGRGGEGHAGGPGDARLLPGCGGEAGRHLAARVRGQPGAAPAGGGRPRGRSGGGHGGAARLSPPPGVQERRRRLLPAEAAELGRAGVPAGPVHSDQQNHL